MSRGSRGWEEALDVSSDPFGVATRGCEVRDSWVGAGDPGVGGEADEEEVRVLARERARVAADHEVWGCSGSGIEAGLQRSE